MNICAYIKPAKMKCSPTRKRVATQTHVRSQGCSRFPYTAPLVRLTVNNWDYCYTHVYEYATTNESFLMTVRQKI